MNEFKEIVTYVAYGNEGAGVLVIDIGCVAGTARLLRKLNLRPISDVYYECRETIGRSILLGLEFLIAGDVIRTVIVSHTMTDVAALTLMVLVRAFLSFTLTLEIEGKLPWAAREERSEAGKKRSAHR
jgi:uncharacterized membrane protein